MIASVAGNGIAVGLTGVGAFAPERVLTNADLEAMVDTSDEWIVSRTGIKERRIAAPEQAASDLALPAARQALEQAGVAPEELDLVDRGDGYARHALSGDGGDRRGRARRQAGRRLRSPGRCTGFVYALSQAYGQVATGLSKKALIVGTEVLSKITNWQDRSTCILFGDGAGAAVVQPIGEGGIAGFELGADGSGGPDLCVPAGGSRDARSRRTPSRRSSSSSR